ncbi:hypothetical protein [Blastococcus sp. VKM Ac-2987]|nr:hypothetical protein [Blastococcus sp. VKM Ac-2987]MCZ2857487.1 hypothetical protein [Blastococcus sp. VKM Ac-2987]
MEPARFDDLPTGERPVVDVHPPSPDRWKLPRHETAFCELLVSAR